MNCRLVLWPPVLQLADANQKRRSVPAVFAVKTTACVTVAVHAMAIVVIPGMLSVSKEIICMCYYMCYCLPTRPPTHPLTR